MGARGWERLADPALRPAAASWFGIAVLGQLLFAIYVAGFYGRAAVQGRLEKELVIPAKAGIHFLRLKPSQNGFRLSPE